MLDVAQRVLSVRQRVDSALARSPLGMRPITLIAVTKYHPAAMVDAVAQAGLKDVGESRVQEVVAKVDEVASTVRWHFVGHLQRNKAAKAMEIFDVIHSVDAPRLVDAMARSAHSVQLFVQVNISGESTKRGVAPEAVRDLLQGCRAAPNLEPLGLMTMAPYGDDPEAARPVFRGLRELRDELAAAAPATVALNHLSMGMSNDFEVAIEEGATLVRLGSVLFSGLTRADVDPSSR